MDIKELLAQSPAPKQNLPRDIFHRLRTLIISGRLEPGTQLPAEVELADALGVSRNTVRDALNLLQQEGSIIRQHGVGTFVTEQLFLPNRLDINLGVTELVRSFGWEPGTRGTHIQEIIAGQKWSKPLQIAADSRLIEITRIRTGNERPLVYTLDVVPRSYLQSDQVDFTLDDLQNWLMTELSIYEALKRHFNLYVDHAIVSLKPAKADTRLAGLLEIKEGSLLMFLEQVDYDAQGIPLLVSHEYHRADTYTFTVYRKR